MFKQQYCMINHICGICGKLLWRPRFRIPIDRHHLASLIDKYDQCYTQTMTWFDIYNEFIKNYEKLHQLQKDYIINLERINHLYNESIKSIERVNELYNESIRNYEKMNKLYEQQLDNMQRMNQKWFDVFTKSWGQQQNEKT